MNSERVKNGQNAGSTGGAAATRCFRVLGVDPAASGPTGYGVIESDGGRCKLLHYGALRITAKRHDESLGAALQDVHAMMCKLIEEFTPDVLAVEGIFSALNVRTALRLAEVRGVVLLAAAQNNIVVHSYSPREVKASVAGHGNADKRQMQVMVRSLLKMAEIPEPADAADALAVALCHLQAEQTRAKFALPETKGRGKGPRRQATESSPTIRASAGGRDPSMANLPAAIDTALGTALGTTLAGSLGTTRLHSTRIVTHR